MPNRYMLDTDILSELIRRPASLQSRAAEIGEPGLCTSVVNACELCFGARKKASDSLSNRVEQLLGTRNLREFRRVPGLQTENWLSRQRR